MKALLCDSWIAAPLAAQALAQRVGSQ